MSVRDRAAMRAAERAHERALALASDAIDMELASADASWLAEHLRGCAACRSIAAEYRVLHDELRGLVTPEPPRDLWPGLPRAWTRSIAGAPAAPAWRA